MISRRVPNSASPLGRTETLASQRNEPSWHVAAKWLFFTALYHSMIKPNIYNDVEARYRGRDLKVHKAEGFDYYTVFSLWDTYRAEHPLYNH